MKSLIFRPTHISVGQVRCVHAVAFATLLATTTTPFVGCTAIAKAGNYVLNPDAEELRHDIAWHGPVPKLRRTDSSRTIFVAFSDASGSGLPGYEIQEAIISRLEKKGYRIADEIDSAALRLEVVLRYFGENPKADRGAWVPAGIGAVAGGTLAYAVSSSASFGARLALTTAGALGGGLAAAGISARMKVREFDLIADVTLYEELQEPITRTVQEVERREGTTISSVRPGSGVTHEQSEHSTATQEKAEAKVIQTHSASRQRLTAWVQRARLVRDEALAHATPRLADAIGGVLPQVSRRRAP